MLSLFPGIGLLDKAFEEEGFCVVRGPDALWGGDIRTFHPPPGVFDGVIGGPPCQAFSRLRHLVEHNGYKVAPNLIPEFERCVVEAVPTWFLMENVEAAPLPGVPGYSVQDQLVSDFRVGGQTTRIRRFTFGSRHRGRFEVVNEALWRTDPGPPAVASGGAVPGRETERHRATRKGASAMGYKTKEYLALALRAQGLPGGFLAGAPFTVAGKIKVVGNGVPLPMGRAVVQAVREATRTCTEVVHGPIGRGEEGEVDDLK